MAFEICMPKISDNMKEGKITSWNKRVGDFIQREDIVAEFETEEAIMELVGYQEGTILYLNGKVGDSVAVTEIVALVGYKGEDISDLLKSYNLPEVVYEPQERKRIFFSYSRSDKDFALQLAQELKYANKDIWIDILDIRPGEPWDISIQTALKNAECVLSILSDSSVRSNNVLNEIHYAIDYKKKIIPILYSDCELPFLLYRIQYIDFRSDYKTGINKLLNSLE